MKYLIALILGWTATCIAQPSMDWPQGAGPGANFRVSQPAPTVWSAAQNKGLAWRTPLPESGQSTPVLHRGKLFLTTNLEVHEDSTLGADIVAWCLDAADGRVLWRQTIPGTHPLRLSGCFSDASSPPALCHEDRVVFVNAAGTVQCFDLEGRSLWKREMLTAGRTLPFYHQGACVLTRQVYPPDPDGNFPHKYAESPLEMWTQLQALEMETGEVRWTSTCGVNMGCAIVPWKLSDGRSVAVVGRGGGHGPPERPDGISLVDLQDGATLWTLPLEGFMATMCFGLRNDRVELFDDRDHISVDALTGKVVRRDSIVSGVTVFRREGEGWKRETLDIPTTKSTRMITQTSDLLVGRYHYFRSYTTPYLGRVDVDSGKVEYLELPLQLARLSGQPDRLQWYQEPKDKKDPQLKNQAIVANDMRNTRGWVVVGDERSRGNGWGHVAAVTPTVAGQHLYVPVMNGTVYVLRWEAPVLDGSALVAINDLGQAGQAWNRASLAVAGGRIYAHTLREVLCIQGLPGSAR